MFLKAVLAILALPVVVVVIVPTLLITVDPWRASNSWLGYLLLIPGLWLLFDCIRTFYVAGKGTLAPWSPPERLVQIGFYQYTRNPMYVGIILIIGGLSLRFGSPLLGAYMLFLAVTFHINLVFFEEPQLRSRFGENWNRYVAEVPRWLPRLGKGN